MKWQLYVEQGGRVLVDEAHGCRPDALFWLFSASKPFTAVVVHRLAERGVLDLDEPIAVRWPEFGRHGKGELTVRHVLRHRTGLPASGADALAMTSWRRSVRRAENARLEQPPGSGPGYLPLAYGFILGELLQRITTTPMPELLGAEVLTPLGLDDTYLGLPDRAWPRAVPLRVDGPAGWLIGGGLNRRRARRAVVPAAGISTTARDLGRFYRALLAGQLLQQSTLDDACRPTSDGERDRHVGAYIRWSEGFQLGGPRTDPLAVLPMGRRSSPRAFGHNGSNCCIGWADPDRDLVFAYLTDRVPARRDGVRRLSAMADRYLD